jgi:Recombinase
VVSCMARTAPAAGSGSGRRSCGGAGASLSARRGRHPVWARSGKSKNSWWAVIGVSAPRCPGGSRSSWRRHSRHVRCPSAHDPDRNRHRCGIAWSKYVIRAILTNPRYIGRQVWNRQRKDEVLLDVHDIALGHTTKMRWNDEDKWIYSEEIVHPPIIGDSSAPRTCWPPAEARAVRTSRTSPGTPTRSAACCSAASAIGVCRGTGPMQRRTTGAGSPPSTPSPTASAIR